MAAVADKIKSVVDFLVKGFEPRESFEDLADEMNEEVYEVQDNLAVDPAYTYQPKEDKTSELKVINHPNYRGYEVMVMEPRSFDDAAQIVQHLKDRKTLVLNLHLLDKEQSQRTIDFVCGAASALGGQPQKVGDMVFVFTPSTVTLTVDSAKTQTQLGTDNLWTGRAF